MQELFGVNNVGYFINEVTLMGRLAPDQPPISPGERLRLMKSFIAIEGMYNDFHLQQLRVDQLGLILTYPVHPISAIGVRFGPKIGLCRMRLDYHDWFARVDLVHDTEDPVTNADLAAMVAPGSTISWIEYPPEDPNPLMDERKWEHVQSVRLGSQIIRKIYMELATKSLDGELVVPANHLPQYAADFLAITALPGGLHGYAWRIPTAPIVSVLSRWSWNQLPDYYKVWIMVAGIRHPMPMQQRRSILEAIPLGAEPEYVTVIPFPENLYQMPDCSRKVSLDMQSQYQASDRFTGITAVHGDPVAVAFTAPPPY
jgi:hypothetical protein